MFPDWDQGAQGRRGRKFHQRFIWEAMGQGRLTVCVSRRPPEGHAREQGAVGIVPEWKIAPTGRSAARVVRPLR
jgi:hypothetical protein